MLELVLVLLAEIVVSSLKLFHQGPLLLGIILQALHPCLILLHISLELLDFGG